MPSVKVSLPTREIIRRTSNKLILLILAALIAFAYPAAVMAQSQQQIQQLQEQINEVQTDTNQKRETHGILDIEASSLQEAINKLQAQINESQSRINQLQAEVNSLNEQITAAEAELVRQKEVLGQNIKLMYLEGDISTFEMLLSSKDLSDFVDREQYRNTLKSKITNTMEAITRLKEELNLKRATVQATLGEQQALRDQLAGQRAELDQVLALNQAQKNQLQNQIQANSGQLAELKRKQAEAEAALARALAQASYRSAPSDHVAPGDVVGAVGNTGLSSGPHLHLEVRAGGGPINPAPYMKRSPVDSPPGWISQGYGIWNPLYYSGYHLGIDYAANSQAAIYAIDGGRIYRGCSNQLLNTSNNAYGYVAIVEHGNGIRSIYAHMSGGPSACNYNTYR